MRIRTASRGEFESFAQGLAIVIDRLRRHLGATGGAS
jgi:hypothetical protein